MIKKHKTTKLDKIFAEDVVVIPSKNKGIELTEDQKVIFEQMKDFCTNSDRNKMLITGFAGTGKTTLTTKFVDWFSEGSNHIFSKIAITAPTHKAVKVLKKMTLRNKYSNKIVFSTLHSILGLRPMIDDNGMQKFKRDKFLKPSFETFGLVIIDEASMIDDDMFSEIIKQNIFNCKIIFVGDSEQIPPINQDLAIPFNEEKREEYGIEKFSLVNIIRQSKENPIINATKKIRDGEFHDIDKSVVFDESDDKHGVFFINDTAMVKSELKKYFCSDRFTDDSDYAKVIAWRNVTVDTFNKVIRGFLFGKDIKKIIIGDKLIADKAIMEDKEVLINTNEDMSVIKLKESYKTVEGVSIKYYNAIVECDSGNIPIDILHEDDEDKFKKICDKLAKEAKNAPMGNARSKAWKHFYKISDTFASVKYNYAITAHRAQGSTYINTFVVANDIMINKNKDESRKILYTACSRPKNKLFII